MIISSNCFEKKYSRLNPNYDSFSINMMYKVHVICTGGEEKKLHVLLYVTPPLG